MPLLLSVATTGAIVIGAGFGVMPAAADPQPNHESSVTVDIVGDSYMAGDGLRDTYLDPADPRHRSTAAPALQALARVQSDNSRLRVDANLVAASGAETADFFFAQAGPGNTVVNPPQHDQIRPDTQLVVVGFGGDDAHLAAVLADARRTTGGPNTALDKEIRALGPLLDWAASDQEYLDQAKSSPPGQAPTLVARMLQVLAGVTARAPHAKIVVTTYPLAADPRNAHAASLIGEDELTSVRKFGFDLNKAIDRAVRICGCGSLADLSEAVAGHEIYTADSAFDERQDQEAPQERFQPNDRGASLIANPIATSIARVLQIASPKPSDGRMTVAKNIAVRSGVSDRDGDAVADNQDVAPDDPTRSTDTPRPERDTGHGANDWGLSPWGSRSKNSDDTPQPLAGVFHPIIQVVDGWAPGVSLTGPYDRSPADPAGERHPVTVGSRPPAREHTVPLKHTALALEPAAAPPVPGGDASPLSQARIAAMQDVISKAEPAGYVSLYSAQALRASTLPADARVSLDLTAVDRQMSGSFLNDPRNTDVRDGFRAQFSENIDAIHNATTVNEQDAAIARFDQTAMSYNTTELAGRDAYGGHPVDARGDTVRVAPISLADVAVETTTFGSVDVNTLSTVSDQQTQSTQAQVDAVTYGSNSPSVGTGVKVGPAAEVGVKGQTEIGGVTVSGEADAKGLGGEANASAGASKDGVNAKVGARGYLGEATAEGSAKFGPAEAGVKGKANIGAEAGANASFGGEGVDVGMKGFVGAKVGVDGHADLAGVRVGGTAEGWYGLGAEGRARLGWGPDGSFTIGVDAGVAVGPGVKFGIDVTVPGKTQKAVQDTMDALNPWGPAEDNVQQPQVPTSEPESAQPDLAATTEQPTLSDQAPPSDFDADYSGPTPGTTGENDDPGYSTEPATDSPVNPDAAISGTTAPASDTIAGSSDNDTLGKETNTGYSDAGYSDSGLSDSGFGNTSDPSGGLSTSDSLGGLGDSGSGGGIGGGDTGGMGDSGMGGDSGGMGGDSGGDSGGGVGGGDSGGGTGGGDSGGGTGSGGMSGGPSGGDGGGF